MTASSCRTFAFDPGRWVSARHFIQDGRFSAAGLFRICFFCSWAFDSGHWVLSDRFIEDMGLNSERRHFFRDAWFSATVFFRIWLFNLNMGILLLRAPGSQEPVYAAHWLCFSTSAVDSGHLFFLMGPFIPHICHVLTSTG